VAPRRLLEAEKLKPQLEGAVKDYMWTVGDAVENTLVISEKVGEVDVAIFRAVLTEVEIPGSTEKRQYLTLENRPKDDADEQFKRYKRAHLLFRRKLDPKDNKLVIPFIRHCVEYFKALNDRLTASQSAKGLLLVVQETLARINVPGVVLTPVFVHPRNAYFQIKDGYGNLRYSGNIYKISADYMGLSLWTTDEFVYIYSGQGTEQNFRARLEFILRTKLSQPFQTVRVSAAKDKVLYNVKARCPNDTPTLEKTTLSDMYYATRLVSSSSMETPKSCMYSNSKLLIIEYRTGKLHFLHFLVDLKEFQTEDMLVPAAALFDNLLFRSFEKNARSVDFIRASRAKSSAEQMATEEKIRAALVAVFRVEPTEETINDAEKGLVEVEERKWLHFWRFGKTVKVNLYQNPEEFILEVSKPDASTGSITTTQIAIPVYNGYDHIGLVQQQLTDFMNG
jgi:hypothetical protein